MRGVVPQGPFRIVISALDSGWPGLTSFMFPHAADVYDMTLLYSVASSCNVSGLTGGACPPAPWQGADAHCMMAPPPLNAVFTVSKVAGGVVVPPLGTHAADPVPPVPPVPVGLMPSSMWPAQPTSDDRSTADVMPIIELRNFIRST